MTGLTMETTQKPAYLVDIGEYLHDGQGWREVLRTIVATGDGTMLIELAGLGSPTRCAASTMLNVGVGWEDDFVVVLD